MISAILVEAESNEVQCALTRDKLMSQRMEMVQKNILLQVLGSLADDMIASSLEAIASTLRRYGVLDA
jgi:hypothetical protein